MSSRLLNCIGRSTAVLLISALVLMRVSLAFCSEERPAPSDPVLLPAAEKRPINFQTDIQPILAKSCYQCHGPEKQQSGLRLDVKQAALEGGDSGRAIEVQKSAESLLVQLVAGVDENRIMPPKGERLTTSEIGLLRGWIDQGANWPDDGPGSLIKKSDHWSYQPIRRVELPIVKDRDWIVNPIDAFVLAKLEQHQVLPAPEADRATLIRRLYLDLLGLAPPVEMVTEFLQDSHPQAYEHLVDRILESPHFGERWGRHWLDLARYADSDGYEKDSPRPFAFRYRNWVIDAINRDLPFDQFTIEQLAGDLLPNATLEQKIATGFHRNTLTNREGGADQEEFRVAATVDRVNTLGTVWMGLTVGCAQCHSHKYDQFTQREYYQLFSFFNSIEELNLEAPEPQERQERMLAQAKFDAQHVPLVEAVKQFLKNELSARQSEWEAALAGKPPVDWITPSGAIVSAENGTTFEQQADGGFFATGANPPTDTYTISIQSDLKGITGLRLEVLPDDRLPSKGPGRVAHGNFVLSEFSAAIVDSRNGMAEAIQQLKNPSADFEQGVSNHKGEFPIENVLDGKTNTGWAIAPRYGVRHVAIFETSHPIQLEPHQRLVIRLSQQHGLKHTIGRFRLSLTTANPPLRYDSIPDSVLQALKVPTESRTQSQRTEVVKYYQTIDPELARLNAIVAAHLQKAPPASVNLAQVVKERDQPRPTHMLVRGDFLRKGDLVSGGTPAVLPSPVSPLENRLDLARWLVDPSNPMTPRVTVNLWWQYLFGRGLVATVEDFGVRGELPSHPELLDWLAAELIQQNWSRKAIVRLIVSSATYRQSSRNRPELIESDPKNTWISRQNRFRLEAEIVRDLYLSSSGLLHRQVGGPSVRPPLPPGIAELGYAGSIRWPESQGSDKYRRGMYIFFQRTVPFPMLMSFDAPDSNSSCVRRERSNTPLQALTLLNDPVLFECAQALGKRAAASIPTASLERVKLIFRLCLAREPNQQELGRLWQLHEELKSQLVSEPEAQIKIVNGKQSSAEALETATAILLGRIILNLDEFVVRD